MKKLKQAEHGGVVWEDCFLLEMKDRLSEARALTLRSEGVSLGEVREKEKWLGREREP